jgi:dihydroorotase
MKETLMRMVIRNARLADANGLFEKQDVYVRDGVIEGFDLGGGVDLEVDGQGCVLAPAFIDPHAHLREPGQEVKENLSTGLLAAAAGGFGTVVSMPNTSPVVDQPETVRELIEKAERLGFARLIPAAAMTRGQEGKQLTDAVALHEAGVRVLTDDGRTVEDAGVLRRALEYSAPLGLVISVHAEDASLRGDGVMNEGVVSERLGLPGNPVAAEAARIARDLEVLAAVQSLHPTARLNVQHLSSARGLELVRQAKTRGLNVTCEVTPHHLTLTDAALEGFDPIFKVAPPLRTEADVQALINGVLDGTIDCVGTDHAPHTRAEKEQDMLEAPFGIGNIEVTFPLLYTVFCRGGELRLERLLELLTTGPARVLGMPAPSLEVGAPADLVLLDLETEHLVDATKFKSKAKFSPWDGQRLRGWPVLTIVRGKLAFDGR